MPSELEIMWSEIQRELAKKKSEKEWKKILTWEQYSVMRLKHTELAGKNKYHDFCGEGIYECAACGSPLFSSTAKLYGDCGWPTFSQPISTTTIATSEEVYGHGIRTRVSWAACDGHLGYYADPLKPQEVYEYESEEKYECEYEYDYEEDDGFPYFFPLTDGEELEEWEDTTSDDEEETPYHWGEQWHGDYRVNSTSLNFIPSNS